MAAGNQVVLTFGAETKAAENGFDRVGKASKEMEHKVRESGGGFDRVGEAADELDTKAMGFRDTITGVQDTMSGFKALTTSSGDASKRAADAQAAYNAAVKKYGEHSTEAIQANTKLSAAQEALSAQQQSLADKLFTLGAGIGDLGSSFYNFLVPSMKAAVTGLKGMEIGTIASSVAQKTAAVASKVWAAGQWLLNAALTANPIGLVVVAIAALVAIVILAWKHSETFRRIVIGAWTGIKAAALAVGSWFKNTLWPWIKGVADGIGNAFGKVPGLLKSAFSGLFNILTWPFRTAMNFIVDIWNNTIGRLSWTVPGWVPVIGGNTISVPKLPHFHTGIDRVPGPPGSEMLAVLQAGERVTPASQNSGGEMAHVTVVINGDVLVEAVSKIVRRRGGSAQLVLGGRNA